jgi:hypothetical protein
MRRPRRMKGLGRMKRSMGGQRGRRSLGRGPRRRLLGRGPRRLGSIITVRTAGLGELSKPNTWFGAAMPATIGGLTAAAVTVGLRHFMKPTSEMQMKLMEYAPWLGLGAGFLTAMMITWTSGKPAGLGVAAGASAVATAMMVGEWAAGKKLAQVATAETASAMKPYGLGRLSAIVMEPTASRGYGAGPVGAIVPTVSRSGTGAYGDEVNLAGVNSSAFGTPGFHVSGAR